jgi:SAM-dependent methyltransferase
MQKVGFRIGPFAVISRVEMKAKIRDAAELYTGDAGRAYHDRRSAARRDDDQRQRAEYFGPFTRDHDTVLDFGCATGGILANLPAAVRIGVEINETAAAVAKTQLDQVFNSTTHVADESVDVVMSFHAIEHVGNPLLHLQELHRVLKPGGHGRFIVPLESVMIAAHRRWEEGDRDMHLYSWTPRTFANLLMLAGFKVEDVSISPMSGGGKLARLFPPGSYLNRAAKWLKALRLGIGRFQLLAIVHKA